NTARNSKAEVEFPMNGLIFTSSDNKDFEYYGDVMLGANNNSGSYKVQSFELKGEAVGRFVKLIIATKSKFVFIDEVEIYGERYEKSSSFLNKKQKLESIKKDELGRFVTNILTETTEGHMKSIKVNSVRDFLGSLSIHLSENTRNVDSLYEKQRSIMSKFLPNQVIFTSIKSLDDLNSFNLDHVNSPNKLNSKEVFNEDGIAYFSLINNKSNKERIIFELSNKKETNIYEI